MEVYRGVLGRFSLWFQRISSDQFPRQTDAAHMSDQDLRLGSLGLAIRFLIVLVFFGLVY